MRFLLLTSISTFAAAALLPPAPRSALLNANPGLLDNKCTFTLWHRQQSSSDYVQLNTIFDHANKMTIDVASRRPATAFNSYTRLDREHSFAVAGLLDDARLTVAYGEGDVLRFKIGEVEWSTERTSGEHGDDGKRVEAWCNVWGWDGDSDRRERRLDCAFPCEDAEDLESEEYARVREEGSQAMLGLE